MERIKRIKELIFFLLIALVPFIGAKAEGSITAAPGSLNLRAGASGTITISANNAAGRVDISSSNQGVATVSSPSEFLDNSSVTITVTGHAEGTANIVVRVSDAATYDKEVLSNVYTIPVNVTVPDTNANLATLSVSGCSINFDPNVISYDCGEKDVNGVTVSAVAAGRGATISGNGWRNVQYGRNNLSVIVTAESGARKTYSIIITRPDNRSGDTTLKSLVVEGQNLSPSFDPNTYDYTLVVPNKVESVNVSAVANDTTATVAGAGVIALPVIGDEGNLVSVTVTAENGKISTYTIKVIRSELENIPSAKLLTIKINDNVLNVKDDERVILYGVDSSVTSLNLEYETTSRTTTYEVTGNDYLKDGINVISIKVSDTGVKTETYTLIVNKAGSNAILVDDISKISNFDKDVIYNTNGYQNPTISDNVIKLLNSSSNKLIYNVTNKDKGLLYSVTFSKDSGLSKAFEPYFNRINDEKVMYSTNIPAKTKIKLYIGTLFENNDSVKVYAYDQNSDGYNLVTTASVKDYYLEFETNGATKYVLSKEDLKAGTKKKETKSGGFNIIYIILIILLIGFIVFLVFKNKKLSEEVDNSKQVPVKDDDSKLSISPKMEEDKPKKEVNDFVIEEPKGKKLEMDEKNLFEEPIKMESEKNPFEEIKKPELDVKNPFEEKKEDIIPMEDIKPIKTDDIKPLKEDNIGVGISKFPSLEEELRKNKEEDNNDIGRSEVINPFEQVAESKDDVVNPFGEKNQAVHGYTVDLTSIEEEIKRHEFEEEISKRIQKSNSARLVKNVEDDERGIDLISVDEDIKRHSKRSAVAKDKVKVVDSEPYPSTSRATRKKKLEDTGIIPVLSEEQINDYKPKNSRRVEDDDDDF